MTATTERYAELTLYTGLARIAMCYPSEGRFNKDLTDDYARNRWLSCMREVHDRLSGDWGLTICGYSLVNSEEEARRIIDHAKQNIEGATDTIDLDYVAHGEIKFHRNLRFLRATERESVELIHKLRQSGYSPPDSEVEEFMIFVPEISEDEARKYLEEKGEYDPDAVWKRHLKFY